MIQIEASPEEIYDIELEHSLLEANAKLADENRALLEMHGATAIDVMGAIGSGKTTLITRLVEKLKDRVGLAIFNGDATTSNDVDQIAKYGIPVGSMAVILTPTWLEKPAGKSISARSGSSSSRISAT
jgi:ABC-type cobalamin/Fe3+-siderophores transport system ATPase subunit